MAVIDLFEEIGEYGVTATDVIEQLEAAKRGETITVRINSPGGCVFSGLAIFNSLTRWPGRVEVEVIGWAASAASVIAMAGNKITAAPNGFLLLHQPWSGMAGNASDLRAMADQLDTVCAALIDTYAQRRHIDRDLVREWVDVETLFSADEALEVGLIDAIGQSEPATALAKRKAPRAKFAAEKRRIGWMVAESDEVEMDGNQGK